MPLLIKKALSVKEVFSFFLANFSEVVVVLCCIDYKTQQNKQCLQEMVSNQWVKYKLSLNVHTFP